MTNLGRGSLILAVVTLLFLPAAAAPAFYTGDQKQLHLHYIANEGVMITSGEEKILIDALFSKTLPEYRAPSRKVREAMLAGQYPFAGITLVLVSHNHPDHFDPVLTARFMEKRPLPILVAAKDTVAALKRETSDWSRIKNRVIALDLHVGEIHKHAVGTIRIQALRTLHGDLESPHNLMVLIETNGWRILHEGDSDGSMDTFLKQDLGTRPVDLALVHYFFPLNNKGEEILHMMRCRHIALFHLPENFEKYAPGWLEEMQDHYHDIFFLLPGMKPKVFQPEEIK